MQPGNAHQLTWIAAAVVLLLAGIGGCSGSRTVDAKQLPGTWRMSGEGMDLVWIFSADGSFRWQSQHHPGWLKLLGADMEGAGRRRLDGPRLTIELTETPPQMAFIGQSTTGQRNTVRIERLTDEELIIADSDMRFRRSLVPPKK